MYQHLSSMLFGAIDSAENENHEREICEKEDDEWILVDYIDACTNCSGEDTTGMGLESFPDSAIFSSSSTSSIELLGNCSEPCFLQLASRPLEESWFITPPPCFTAGGLAPIHVETSPLENLLIEHPSMSVYVAHNRNNARESSRSVEYETEAARTAPPAGLDHHIRCYAATLAAHTDLVQQAAQLRHVQRGKEHCAKHLVNRNNIRRQNLNREYISRQTKHSGHALHQPCQRQYNY